MTGIREKLRAAMVIARRDFVAVIFSKTWLFPWYAFVDRRL